MSNPISNHFQQPGGVPAVTLCSGILGAWVAMLLHTEEAEQREIIWMLGVFTALPSALYLVWRVVRPFSGREARPPSRCPVCSRSVATSPVRYLQMTGVVVVMFMRELPAHLCRRCSQQAFLRMTLHTLALGWWSLFSVFITPGFILNNLVFLIRSQLGASGRGHVRSLLDERREYALNLLATKDQQTVVDVLSRDTGLPTAAVVEWVKTIGG